MKFRYFLLAALIFLAWVGACHFNDLYFKIWWTDIVAHALGGFTLGLFWCWILERGGKTTPRLAAISIATFAATISVLWEFWEFSNWRWAFLRETVGRLQGQYYPVLGNNLGDIWWGFAGGLFV